jgi:hypothetical protein
MHMNSCVYLGPGRLPDHAAEYGLVAVPLSIRMVFDCILKQDSNSEGHHWTVLG